VQTKPNCGFTQLELLIALSVIAVVAAILLPAVQQAREASRRTQCLEHLRGLGQVLQQFEGVHRRFPPSVPFSPRAAGDADLWSDTWYSPHAHLLPYLDQQAISQRIDLTRPTVIAGNVRRSLPEAAQATIPAFLCPSDRGDFGNNYRFCTGASVTAAEDGAFSDFRGHAAARFRDGLSNTAAASESLKSDGDSGSYERDEDYWFSNAAGIGSTTHREVEEMVRICNSLSSAAPPGYYYPFVGHTWLIGGYDFTWYNHAVGPNSSVPNCSANGFQRLDEPFYAPSMVGVHKASSRHPGGVNMLFMDGSARFTNELIDLALWRALATREGREVVSLP
jgi:prepilin-type processing-associated H-X9-DG protein/prepilin-type N-terminal cleavage/methylation domain-containing protein